MFIYSQRWYFTFQQISPWKDHFMVIEGSYLNARREMFRRFNSHWSMQYGSALKAGVEEFNLTELTWNEEFDCPEGMQIPPASKEVKGTFEEEVEHAISGKDN